MNFSENAVELPIDFITDRRQQTIVKNVKSDSINLYQDVPQGTVFGPLYLILTYTSCQKTYQVTVKMFSMEIKL